MDRNELIKLLHEGSAQELESFIQEANMALAIAKRDPRRKTPEAEGTAKDSAVQRLAANFIKVLRSPDQARRLAHAVEESGGISYTEIGARFAGGVSRERIRKLHEILDPIDYESSKGHRRSA